MRLQLANRKTKQQTCHREAKHTGVKSRRYGARIWEGLNATTFLQRSLSARAHCSEKA